MTSTQATEVAPLTDAPQQARGRPAIGLGAVRDYGVVAGLVALFVTLSVASGPFLTKANLLNVVDQSAYVGLIACAGTLVVIAGGVDLSTAAIFGISGVLAAKLGLHAAPAVALGFGALAGGVAGALNGLVTTVGRINSLIATLATGLLVAGLAKIVTKGLQVTPADPGFTTLGNGTLLGMTYTAWAFVVVAALLWFALARTVYGRWVYASGGNPEAARLSGLRVGWIRTSTFVLSGLAAGLAGVLSASRIGEGRADSGTGLEIAALTAIFVGGTSLHGGSGAVWRTVVGVLLVTLINNGFDLLGLDPTYHLVVQGAIILLAVGLDAWSRPQRGGEAVR